MMDKSTVTKLRVQTYKVINDNHSFFSHLFASVCLMAAHSPLPSLPPTHSYLRNMADRSNQPTTMQNALHCWLRCVCLMPSKPLSMRRAKEFIFFRAIGRWRLIVSHCTVVLFAMLQCTVLYCTALYCTVLYCTVLYCAKTFLTTLYYNTIARCFQLSSYDLVTDLSTVPLATYAS